MTYWLSHTQDEIDYGGLLLDGDGDGDGHGHGHGHGHVQHTNRAARAELD